MKRTESQLRHILFGCWIALCAAALCWPGYPLFGNTIEPYVFGIPFSMIWVVGWVMASCLALLLYDLSGRRTERGHP